jgi:hypothetical protein
MNSSIIIGYSFLTALILVFYIFTYRNIFGSLSGIIFWISFLIFSYIANFAVNSIIQYTNCSDVYLGQTSMNSIWVPIFSLLFSIISSIGFFKNAIIGALPVNAQGDSDLYIKIYYMFWAGIFGQMLSGGFNSSCKK